MNPCICSLVENPTPCRGEVELHLIPGTDGEQVYDGDFVVLSGGMWVMVCEFHYAMMKYSHEHRDELDQMENQR